ncbi:hypothetical protein SGPA1_21852 [Streptomyces misionensis JCM 4497]
MAAGGPARRRPGGQRTAAGRRRRGQRLRRGRARPRVAHIRTGHPAASAGDDRPRQGRDPHGRRACRDRAGRHPGAPSPTRDRGGRHPPPRPVHRRRSHGPRILDGRRHRGPAGGLRARGRRGRGRHPVRPRAAHPGAGAVEGVDRHGTHRDRPLARPGRRGPGARRGQGPRRGTGTDGTHIRRARAVTVLRPGGPARGGRRVDGAGGRGHRPPRLRRRGPRRAARGRRPRRPAPGAARVRRRLARAHRRPRAPPRPAGRLRPYARRGPPRPARRRVRHRAGALLRRPAPHRTGLAPPSAVHRGPRVPGHRQQRHPAGPRPPPGGAGGFPAVAAAQHQLAFPLRLRGGVHRTPHRTAARAPEHGVPRQLRFRSGGPGPTAGHRCLRPARRRRTARGVPRLDIRLRRRLHLPPGQPQRACHPPELGPHRGLAQLLPGPAPRDGRRALRTRGRRGDRRTGRFRPPGRGVHRRDLLRQRRRRRPPRRLPRRGVRGGAPPRRPCHRRRGAGRLRPPGALVLGLRAARGRARHRLCRQGHGQRSPPRGRHHLQGGRRPLPRAGLFLLVHRRQPGLQHRRPHRPGHPARRGPPGQRGPCRRSSETAAGGAGRPLRDRRRRPRLGPLPGTRTRPGPHHPGARHRGDRGTLRPHARPRRRRPAHRRPPQHPQDQAAAVHRLHRRGLLRRHARPGPHPTRPRPERVTPGAGFSARVPGLGL